MNPITATETELSREEIIELIEERARIRRGMSAVGLLTAYREGILDNPGEVADLIALADLLEENDPVFQRPT
jgi:hypothetical protein